MPISAPAVRRKIKQSDVAGVKYLSENCRAFGDARGGIAAILKKTDGVSQGEVVQLLEKKAAVIGKIMYGCDYLDEAVAFFQPKNLKQFRRWMIDNADVHKVKQITLEGSRIKFKICTCLYWESAGLTPRGRLRFLTFKRPKKI